MATVEMGRRRQTLAATYIHWHFRVGTLLLLALTLVAFGDNLLTDIDQPSNADPKMVIHGLFLLAWMVLLVVQATFARTGRLRRHRQWGRVGYWVGAGAVLSTLYLFVAVWRGWATLTPEVLANRIMLPSFALCVAAGLVMRDRPEWHKRLIYTGTLLLLSPIISRTFDPLIVPFLPPMAPGEDEPLFLVYFALLWTAFFVALMAYDWLKDRRLHPVSLAALVWLYAVNLFCLAIAPA